MAKFTFKTEKPTGRYAWIDKPTHYIKLKGKRVGRINHENYKIRLIVYKKDIMEDGNPNCKFKNIILKHSPLSVQDAKNWLNENFDKIIALNLHQSE